MRGDRVGVGDVDEVHGGARGWRHASGGDDGRGAGRERESGMVYRGTRPEHDARGQPSWDGIDIGDGAWSEHGAGDVHGTGEGGSDRMRGDRVGVGDGVEVSCCARITWYTASGDDDRRSRRKRDAVLVSRSCWAQCHAATEPCWDGLNIGHYSRVQHGACDIHWEGPRGTHRM